MQPYNELYLADVNELIQSLFLIVAREDKYDMETFIEGFMKCKYRKFLDNGNPRTMNMPYSELLDYLERECPELFVLGECIIGENEAGWYGLMYNMMQYKLGIPSSELYDKIPFKHMMVLFRPLHTRPLHTVGDEVALEKLLASVL